MDLDQKIEEVIDRLKSKYELQKASVGVDQPLSITIKKEIKQLVEEEVKKADNLWSETLHSWGEEIGKRVEYYRNNPDEDYKP